MIGSSSNITSSTCYQDESSWIEFATEIGQGLLSEVKRMKVLLEEKEACIAQLENDQEKQKQQIEDLTEQLRVKDAAEELLKESMYQSELAKQRLSHQIRQLSQSLSKTQMEQIRRERQETLIQQELKHLKTAQAKWQEAQNAYEDQLTLLNDSIAQLEKEKDLILSSSDEEEEEEEEPMMDSKVTTTAVEIPATNDISHSTKHVIKPYVAAISPSIMSSSSITSPSTPRESSFVEDHLPSKVIRSSNELDLPSSMLTSERLDLSLPCIIHTMTGEKAYKLSEGHFKWYNASKRQARFFWVHPYTKTLYWSKCDPGLQNNKAKSG
ncbi:hypothetical protein EDC96DRAFT_506132, partial [Choanephora cucurbitarum]